MEIITTELKEAVRLQKNGAVFLAGGTQVNLAPLERAVPENVIDIRDIVRSGIRMEGTDLIIGALCTLQELTDSEKAPEALRTAAGFIPTRNVRNQATVGGNIGAGRPDSYLIPVLIALSAVARTVDGEIAVEDYVLNNHNDLILEIEVPAPVGVCVAVKESRSHVALPVVSAAVSLTKDEDAALGLTGACVAVGCVAPKTIRLKSVEQAIVSGELNSRNDLESAIRKAIDPPADILGSTAFKTHINGVIIADAVIRCLEALS